LKRKPVVIDKFISQYDSELEYGNIKGKSSQAFYYKLVDKFSCLLADKVFLDSKEQIDYFVKEFSLPEKKFDWFFVGANEDRLKPKKAKKSKIFKVLFYAWVTPVQGFEFIVQAAKSLAGHKDIKFTFIGDSKYYRALRAAYNQKNAEFIGIIPYNQLVKYIGQADAVLAGHFGKTPKALRVIPNKAFEGLAMKKPVILSDMPLSRKQFKDKENTLLVERASPQAIKKAILFLKNNPSKAKKIALNGHKLFKQKFSSKKIGFEIKRKLQAFVPKPF
jgi:glycosyltransferase involved in cell wall biosynthesis